MREKNAKESSTNWIWRLQSFMIYLQDTNIIIELNIIQYNYKYYNIIFNIEYIQIL